MSLGRSLASGWQSFSVASEHEKAEGEQRPAANWQTLKSALLVSATSVIAYPAAAQQAPEPVPLPQLNVEASAKKKAPAKKKSTAKKAPAQVSPAPQAPQPQQAQSAPLPGDAAPVAPGVYNAQYSTSPKTTGPLLNTPQTVNVIPTAIIQERKSTTLLETLKNIPGITIDAGENGFATGGLQFNMRGFNSVGNVFVDGVRDNGAFPRETYNVEQVEVFKGPAADNGRGSAGGYVNVVSKAPTLEDFARAQVGFGVDEYSSEARRRAAFDVNQAHGTTAVRLNSFVQDGGVAGRDVAEANAWGVAPSVAFGLSTETRAIFSYEHVERKDVPDSGVAINRDPNATATAPTLPAKYGVGIKGAGPRAYIKNLPRDTYFGAPTDYDNVDADSFTARFEHDLSDSVTISNLTRWSQVDRQAAYHNGGNGTSIPSGSAALPYDRSNETLTNQTNLAARFATGQFRHTVSAGIEVSREESDAFRPAAGNNANRSNVEVNTLAGYLYDTVELNRQWQLVGGMRVEHYNVDVTSKYANGASGDMDGVDVSETTLGGKIGLVYKPVRDGSIYASYGTSVLPPGSYLSNPDVSRPGNAGTGDDSGAFPGYVDGADPVRMHNYEIGVKWDFFNGKLSTSAAAFHTVKTKVAYGGYGTAANLAVGWPGDTIAYGEQVVDGIEISIAGNLTEKWKVFAGAVWLDSERRHGALVDAAARNENNGDYTSTSGAAPGWTPVTSTDGDELALTPKFSASFWTTYDLTQQLTIGGGIQYVGSSWIGRPDDASRIIPNGKFGKLPDYFLVNLMASYDLTDNIELSLNVDNVFDELYLTTANWNGNWGYLGAPRTYWLNASFKY